MPRRSHGVQAGNCFGMDIGTGILLSILLGLSLGLVVGQVFRLTWKVTEMDTNLGSLPTARGEGCGTGKGFCIHYGGWTVADHLGYFEKRVNEFNNHSRSIETALDHHDDQIAQLDASMQRTETVVKVLGVAIFMLCVQVVCLQLRVIRAEKRGKENMATNVEELTESVKTLKIDMEILLERVKAIEEDFDMPSLEENNVDKPPPLEDSVADAASATADDS